MTSNDHLRNQDNPLLTGSQNHLCDLEKHVWDAKQDNVTKILHTNRWRTSGQHQVTKEANVADVPFNRRIDHGQGHSTRMTNHVTSHCNSLPSNVENTYHENIDAIIFRLLQAHLAQDSIITKTLSCILILPPFQRYIQLLEG